MLPKLRKTRDNHLMERTHFIEFMKKEAPPAVRGHLLRMQELVLGFLHKTGEVVVLIG